MAKITKNYCAIYLVRHGETEWNAQNRIQGQADSPLTAVGEKQALDLAKKLAVITSQALREVKFGQFEGKTGDEFRKELKDLLDQRDQLSETDRFRFKLAPDIESDEELVSRLITFLREIAVAYLNKTVLIDNTAYIKLDSDGVDFFIRETFGIHKVEAK